MERDPEYDRWLDARYAEFLEEVEQEPVWRLTAQGEQVRQRFHELRESHEADHDRIGEVA